MWAAFILPLVAVFVLGVTLIMGAGGSKSSGGAAVRLFTGGALVLAAGYLFIVMVSKLT
ncbi:hypothetical protein MZD04_gp080 [Pseudomonas phage Psa21]|uniref:Uncharacterized protein n=1 Tax=Pseudomonas phage Psa21 TaxID=2530023 RepID=A0A481W4B0_9CAUD|nr:hypothetical protein MZD04_gp080 [Pseudomonas phage Psa21]QBJ02609.1 hypothetical protein PSA21_80 [Pseudomonas phage Psa21]